MISKKEYQCTLCLKILSKKTHCRRHIQHLHPDNNKIFQKLFVCPVCGKMYKSSTGCTSHLTSSHVDHKYACPDPSCTKTYKLTNKLQDHMNNKHKGTKVNKCSCNKSNTKVAHLLCYQRKLNHSLLCTEIPPKIQIQPSVNCIKTVNTTIKLLTGKTQHLKFRYLTSTYGYQRKYKKYFPSGHPQWLNRKQFKTICKLTNKTSPPQNYTSDQLLQQDLDISTSTSDIDSFDTSTDSINSNISNLQTQSMPTMDF